MCVCQHFQTSSPLKPLDQLKPNFMWSLHGMREGKFIQIVQVTWPVWPPCPYLVKSIKNLLLWNQKADDLETWYAASSTRVLPSLFKWWRWFDLDLFYGEFKFAPLCVCMGTHFNSRFPRNYWSLWSESWHIKSIKWEHEDLWIPKVKVIHWSLSVNQISSISNISFKSQRADRSQISYGVSLGRGS